MATKQAEREFANMCGRMNIWCKKWEDVRYCPNSVICEKCGHKQRCGKLIYMTDRDQAVEHESIVDYIIFVGSHVMWVECKGAPGQTRFAFNELTEKQYSFLRDFRYGRKVTAAIFVTLGTQIPDRYAWLIPIQEWDKEIETLEATTKMKSIPYLATNRKADKANMKDLFPKYELQWIQNTGWVISPTHQLAIAIPEVLSLPPLRTKYVRPKGS